MPLLACGGLTNAEDRAGALLAHRELLTERPGHNRQAQRPLPCCGAVWSTSDPTQQEPSPSSGRDPHQRLSGNCELTSNGEPIRTAET
jgi:hypothetical protein